MREKRKGYSRIKTILYILLLLFPCTEFAIRIVGGKPYKQVNYSISISPSNAYIGNDSLGIKLVPGDFSIVLNDKIEFAVSHTNQGNRKVIGPRSNMDSTKIVFLGCSFTYGYGVNDDKHFISLLQHKFSEFNFENYGVIGYGTVQSYIQLKEILKTSNKPDEVVLVFSSFHLERNVMAPSYRRALKIGFNESMDEIGNLMRKAKYPYVSITRKPKISYCSWDSLYTDWTGRATFATVNYLQTAWDNIQENKIDKLGATEYILDEMNKLCQSFDVKFHLVLLDNREEMLEISESVKKNNFSVLNIGFDFNDSTYTNLPYDMHPNELGHQKIANSIEQYFINKTQVN